MAAGGELMGEPWFDLKCNAVRRISIKHPTAQAYPSTIFLFPTKRLELKASRLVRCASGTINHPRQHCGDKIRNRWLKVLFETRREWFNVNQIKKILAVVRIKFVLSFNSSSHAPQPLIFNSVTRRRAAESVYSGSAGPSGCRAPPTFDGSSSRPLNDSYNGGQRLLSVACSGRRRRDGVVPFATPSNLETRDTPVRRWVYLLTLNVSLGICQRRSLAPLASQRVFLAESLPRLIKCGRSDLTERDLPDEHPSTATTKDNIMGMWFMMETHKKMIYQQIRTKLGIDMR
ncbi:hypothetical protein EVAR_13045_1 [Eumeta japonica]|uniref:Uncharacterized protein n=1 Tax=Eumeta variegata TaxID=151549 RepID=A0A4C1VJW8_EUMVA|nr:hypothetical protein EVAR_13045_1 [Eumeta japonica]